MGVGVNEADVIKMWVEGEEEKPEKQENFGTCHKWQRGSSLFWLLNL